MAVLLDFPVNSLKIRNPSVALIHNTQGSQEATNGMRRSLGMSGAQWRMRFDVLVHDEASVRTIRAFLFNMEGNSQLVRIAMPDRYAIDGPFALATEASRRAYPDGIPFATDVTYETGVGHAVPTLDAVLVASAALNDREIFVSAADELPAGCAISINEFCYGVAGSWTDADGRNRIKLSPVLRQDLAVGQVVSLAPLFVGSCVTDSPGYEALVQGYYGEHSLEFVEDLTRLVESVA